MKFKRRPQAAVVGVQLDLDTEGFTYRKWGALQTCKAGDWIVSRRGNTYTVDRESFQRTYRAVGPGQYLKVTPVWAEQTTSAGTVETKEGVTHYEAGAYLVFNEEGGTDGYAMTPETFQELYEPDA